MPSVPTMGMIALNQARAPAKSPDIASIPQAPTGQAATPSQAAPPKSVKDLLPFDAAAYRKTREKELEDEWLPKCANNAACVKKVNEIVDKLLDAEVAGLKSGTPLHTDKAAVTVFQNSLDPIYDPQFKEALPKIATYQPPSGQAVTNNQTAPPKVVVTVTPFDAATYRKTREKEIEAEWMPKCAGNSTCLSRMNAIVDKLLDAEVNALKSGTPDHTNRNAVTAFQNSLDPIYDPQFKAVIPAAPPPPTQATVSNKKPTFNNVTIK